MIKIFSFLTALAVVSASAESLKFSGVLGNSGEQGDALVKFGPKTVGGIGVVYDKYGSLWDRGGEGVLNRYAVDGRLLATYPIAVGNQMSDHITIVGDRIILLIKGKIYKLSIEAASGTKPEDTNVLADGISSAAVKGKLAVLQAGKMSLWDVATGSLEPIWTEEMKDVNDFDLAPDGGLAFKIKGDAFWLPEGATSASSAVPKSAPGRNMQFIDNFLYAGAGHGTIRRFTPDFEASPGVVLGGASGSFIGHVDQISEIGSPSGLAKMERDNFAVSGNRGVLHLLHWDDAKKQFEAVRRIGAIPSCQGLAINRQGDVWYNAGLWKWTDRPESPQQQCTSQLEIGQAVVLPNDAFIAGGLKNGPMILTSNFTWKADITQLKDVPASLPQGSAVYPEEKGWALLLIDAKGKGRSFKISRTGQYQSDLGPVELISSEPVKEWTSLAMKDDETLLAGADGFILELKRDGKNWRESRRWNSWGPDDGLRFGQKVFITADDKRLWVSDSKRHRVLVFKLDSGEFIESYGGLDQSGDSLTALNEPQVISARERRAVVFDSGNQRLVKLVLE